MKLAEAGSLNGFPQPFLNTDDNSAMYLGARVVNTVRRHQPGAVGLLLNFCPHDDNYTCVIYKAALQGALDFFRPNFPIHSPGGPVTRRLEAGSLAAAQPRHRGCRSRRLPARTGGRGAHLRMAGNC